MISLLTCYKHHQTDFWSRRQEWWRPRQLRRGSHWAALLARRPSRVSNYFLLSKSPLLISFSSRVKRYMAVQMWRYHGRWRMDIFWIYTIFVLNSQLYSVNFRIMSTKYGKLNSRFWNFGASQWASDERVVILLSNIKGHLVFSSRWTSHDIRFD